MTYAGLGGLNANNAPRADFERTDTRGIRFVSHGPGSLPGTPREFKQSPRSRLISFLVCAFISRARARVTEPPDTFRDLADSGVSAPIAALGASLKAPGVPRFPPAARGPPQVPPGASHGHPPQDPRASRPATGPSHRHTLPLPASLPPPAGFHRERQAAQRPGSTGLPRSLALPCADAAASDLVDELQWSRSGR
jgi:hypothetical protein